MFDATFFVALSFILFVIFVLWAGLPSTIIKSLMIDLKKLKKNLMMLEFFMKRLKNFLLQKKES